MKEHSDAHAVLITGARTGIGHAMALAFGMKEAGLLFPVDTMTTGE